MKLKILCVNNGILTTMLVVFLTGLASSTQPVKTIQLIIRDAPFIDEDKKDKIVKSIRLRR